MSELLTMQDLANGHLDVKALGEAANGDENTIVTTRTGNTYPSAERAINIMFKNGGLPAIPFETKAKMITDGAALADGQLAQVYNETANNGLYVKTAGAWVKPSYDPKEQAASYTDAKTLQVQGETLAYVNNLNTQLVEAIVKSIGDDLSFLGYLSTTSPDVVNAVDGDGYITTEDGIYFGLTVNKGDYLIRKGGRWYVGNAAEGKIQNGNIGAQESVRIRTNKHLTFKGLLNKDGTITEATSTYFYTGFVRVNPAARVEATTGDSASAIAVAFYDIDFKFLTGYTNRQLPVIAPPSAVYARFCASKLGYRGLYTSRSNNTITFDDFGVKSSLNLATTQNTIRDKFLASNARITSGVGWKMLRIPVDAGTTITFGGFTIAELGYYAFADINDNILVDSLDTFVPITLPVTVTASVSGYLYIDIARPSNVAEHIATLMVNEGNTLLPYEAATKRVISLRGIELAGSTIDDTTGKTYAEIGGDASFSTLEADSITSSILVLNLPRSDVGLDIGQAWVDPITSSIKVKL